MTDIFHLDGKTVLITGASSGIGRAVAQQCAAYGANCIVTARNKERLEATLSSLVDGCHEMFTADLSDADAVARLVEQLPKLDGVVCCAGIVETALLKFSDDQNLQNIFGTNAFSSIRLIREMVQTKKFSKGASVVLISSVSGTRCGYVGGSLYGASKGALEGFAKGIALELAPQQIRVNLIAPGMIETHLLDACDVDSEQLEEDKKRFPLKRYGKPEEVAYAAVYLLSDATKWMTGTSLLLDGGYTLQ